jgi:PAS domain S-box-containing protein
MGTIDRTLSPTQSMNEFVALVVDYDPASRLNLCGLVESEGGLAIEAKNGAGALSAFAERRPDIVLLDTTILDSGGFATCQQIQALPYGTVVPVLVMLAFDDEASVNLALAVGAADYVTKPIRPAILRQRMRHLLQAHQNNTAILRAKKEWEAAVDAVSDMVILTDLQGRIFRCNLATIQRLQTTYLQLIGRDLEQTFLKSQAQALDLSFGQPYEMQFPVLPGWFEVWAFPGHMEGHQHAIVYVLKDITQRRQLEENIRQSEQRFRALVENISEGVELLDAQGKVIYASRIVSRILGMPQGTDLMGRYLMDHLHFEDLEQGVPQFLRLLQNSGGSFTFETRTQYADGSSIWAEATARNMLAEPGINAILMNFRDITARKQLGVTFRQREERFKVLVENITERSSQLVEAIARICGEHNAAIEEASALVAEMSTQVEDVTTSTKSPSEMAEALQTLAHHFKAAIDNLNPTSDNGEASIQAGSFSAS